MSEREPSPASWIGLAVLVGLVYLAVGLVSAALAAHAGSAQLRTAWRVSAFVASGIAFLLHVRRETTRASILPRTVAWHAAVAVALGAFGLAVSALLHALRTPAGPSRILVALPVWPAMLGLPAFAVAWVLAALLRRPRATSGDRS